MTQSRVAALAKGTTINCKLRLVLSHLGASDMNHLYVTPHELLVRIFANSKTSKHTSDMGLDVNCFTIEFYCYALSKTKKQ